MSTVISSVILRKCFILEDGSSMQSTAVVNTRPRKLFALT